eukprot:1195131-Prorocentrum_minimum.AAC.3
MTEDERRFGGGLRLPIGGATFRIPNSEFRIGLPAIIPAGADCRSPDPGGDPTKSRRGGLEGGVARPPGEPAARGSVAGWYTRLPWPGFPSPANPDSFHNSQ